MDDSMLWRLSSYPCVTYDGQGRGRRAGRCPACCSPHVEPGLRRVSISHPAAAPGTRIGDSSGAEPARGRGAGGWPA